MAQSVPPDSSAISFASLKDVKLPDGYIFPLHAGRRAMLTGTMGELRSTHFHAGLDIDTEGIGQPVVASNEGYIYRATVATGGYGTVLYVRHNDGRGTVYAHLNELVGPIAEYVLQERYRRKQSEVDLFFKPGEFPVSRGEIIARSGNTGGSGGPHLHFELRGPREEALNPMTLGFTEIIDNTPPVPQKIAFRTMDINSRVNDQFGRFEYHLQRKGKDYVLNQSLLAHGRIGLEILAHDKQENSRFRFGINLIEVFANKQKVFTQKIDKVMFSETRNILALLDFRTMETKGYRFNKLYVDDGNKLPYYAGTVEKNGIEVMGEDIEVEIKLIDFDGNSSSVFTTLKAAPVSKNADFNETTIKSLSTDISGSVLTLNVNMCEPADESSLSSGIQVYSNGAMQLISPSYSARARNVFLVDLNKMQPDSVVTCSGTWVSNFRDRVPSGTPYRYYSDLIDVDFQATSLYDTLFLATSYDSTFRETFTVGSRLSPLRHPVRIQLKPLKQYEQMKSVGVYRIDGNGYTFMNSAWKNDKVSFNSLALGQYTIMYDTVTPSVRALNISGSVARLRIRDELSGISYFEASINGQWLLMTYDYKTGIVYSERLDRKIPLKGDFELKVVDNAGNESIFKHRIP
ncbi:MAG TPA: M23 family metallopeptidase [Cyclobacteriaceae bacterium]|nr:M23 family metallopeptidase [Cyclobacteriaceae bacterium]